MKIRTPKKYSSKLQKNVKNLIKIVKNSKNLKNIFQNCKNVKNNVTLSLSKCKMKNPYISQKYF